MLEFSSGGDFVKWRSSMRITYSVLGKKGLIFVLTDALFTGYVAD